MFYAVVETLLGNIGLVHDTFIVEEEANLYASNHPKDVTIMSLTEEQVRAIEDNGGYIEEGTLNQ